MAVYSGGDTVVLFQVEATYGTSPGWTTAGSGKHFGPGVKISNIKRNNGTKPIWGLGTRATQAVAIGTWAGSFDVEFALSDHIEWIAAIFGDDTGTAYTPQNSNKGLSVLVATDPTLTGNTLWKFLTVFSGCVITSAKFSFEAGENPVMVTLSFVYKSEACPAAASKTLATYATPTSNYDTATIFSFGQVNLKTLDNNTGYIIERAEVTLTSNTKMVYGLGNRLPQGKADAPIEFTGTATVMMEDETLQKASYNGTYADGTTGPANTLSAMTSAGASFGISSSGITIVFTNPYITSHSVSQQIGEAIMQDLEFMGTSVTINDT